MQKFIKNNATAGSFTSFTSFNTKLAAIDSKVSETEENRLENLKKEKQRALVHFSFIAILCKHSNTYLPERIQNYFIKTLEHRNLKESCFLTQVLMQNFERSAYISNYQVLIYGKSKNKDIEHLICPMIIISQWLTESSNLQRDALQSSSIQEIKAFLKSKPRRASLRSAKGFLSNFLQALISLSSFSSISLEKKLYLLCQCFQFSLQGPDWEKLCKQSLDIVNILAGLKLLPDILEKLDDSYDFKEIMAQFNRKLQIDIFGFDRQISNFHEKYLQIESALRIPLCLVKYAANLRVHQNSKVSRELQRLVLSIFNDTVQEERYQTERNPHLQQIKQNYPVKFHAWQTSKISIEKALSNNKKRSVDFLAFLQEKVLVDNHLPCASLQLIQYLQNTKTVCSIEGLNEINKEIFLLCKDLCNSSIGFNEKLYILKELPNILYECEFKNDINILLISLTTTNQCASVLIVDTDDWQDLFLSGTEVLGSCQRIDGDPFLNVCLMAYVLDGKNRLLAIKDPKNKSILARCIFRLLWDPKNHRPVLFQERIYPFSCPQEYKNLLNLLADTRAKDLGLELFTINQRDNLNEDRVVSLQSLGSCSPYEYADASSGVIKDGIFTIPKAKAVTIF